MKSDLLAILRWSRRSLTPPLLVVFVGLTAGCYSPGRSYVSSDVAPVDESVRSGFGKVGLLLVDRGPTFVFHYPRNTADATADIAEGVWKAGDYDDGPGEFVGGLLFSGAVGLIGGAIVGVPQSEILSAEDGMRQALRQQPLMAEISARIQASFDKRGQLAPVVIAPELAGDLSKVPLNERDYCALAALGIDSVMEISVEWHGFRKADSGNAPMMMEAIVHVQIARVSDGALLFGSPVHYHGHQHRFRCWAEKDARRFKSELRRIGRMVGEGVVEQVFGPSTLAASR